MKLYKTEDGKKLYPVCKWEDNQHKLYNAHDRIMNAIYDARENGEPEPYEQLERIEKAMDAFEKYVINGIIYATYQDGLIIKDYIFAYDLRHK